MAALPAEGGGVESLPRRTTGFQDRRRDHPRPHPPSSAVGPNGPRYCATIGERSRTHRTGAPASTDGVIARGDDSSARATPAVDLRLRPIIWSASLAGAEPPHRPVESTYVRGSGPPTVRRALDARHGDQAGGDQVALTAVPVGGCGGSGSRHGGHRSRGGRTPLRSGRCLTNDAPQAVRAAMGRSSPGNPAPRPGLLALHLRRSRDRLATA
jgi:hypothetical protein